MLGRHPDAFSRAGLPRRALTDRPAVGACHELRPLINGLMPCTSVNPDECFPQARAKAPDLHPRPLLEPQNANLLVKVSKAGSRAYGRQATS